jgi:membrane protease YdiL (CAAX protease family)
VKAHRLLEMLLLFLGVPVALDLLGPRIPVIAVLPVLGFLTLGFLARAQGFDLRRELRFPTRAQWVGGLREILPRFIGVSAVTFLGLWFFAPDALWDFPRHHRGIWQLLLLTYLPLSVLPQTLIYRSFFEWRYQKVMAPGPRLWVGAALFGAGHLMFHNAWAIGLTFLGGLVFTETYRKTGSIWITSLEHALYGWMLFTVGMGKFITRLHLLPELEALF